MTQFERASDDFATFDQYNDHLEMLENWIFNLVNNENLEQTRHEIEQYKRQVTMESGSLLVDDKRKGQKRKLKPKAGGKTAKKRKLEDYNKPTLQQQNLFRSVPRLLSPNRQNAPPYRQPLTAELLEKRRNAGGFSSQFMQDRMMQEACRLVFCV
eukprot:CAMPEP_0117450518 /NCGR_PEP_ID=MMETSP0759-20121206/8510_1 /TAXON_ID=63605 /ORGANISM="Percolomonas cosmopolitus, Strain WS" /LENGTH=154 /DNA_ID=CAMNT_0005243043 /DNA_START=219 /DNA_END=683 /DNA_ORIENTATION=+